MARERFPDEPGLELAERRFTARLEQLRDRDVRRGDRLVDVDELPAEQACDVPAPRRLAGAHEADEDDVPV